jgi:1,4-alpha-glucan branching enzyme
MLAVASDRAFTLNAGTMVKYGEKLTRDHLHDLNGIYAQITEHRLERGRIEELEARTTIFREMNYRVFARADPAPHQQRGTSCTLSMNS